MELLLLVANFILLVITGFYAWFTFTLVKQGQQENSVYKSALEKQLKLSSMPHVYCDMQYDVAANSAQLEVYNVGTVPAYDMLVSIIGSYTEESLDIPSLMRSFIQPRYRKYPLQVDKVGYYGIRSVVRTPMLPAQQKLAIALSLPIRPVDVYVFIQFREVLGWNYDQVYCFSDLDDYGKYRANILEPLSFEPIDRLHLYDLDDVNPTTLDKSLPYQVVDFLDLWNHSLSHRLTTLYADANPQAPGTQNAPPQMQAPGSQPYSQPRNAPQP